MNEREIFIEAPEEASPEELAAYLDEACGGDAALRRRVQQMLAVTPKLGTFMNDPGDHWSSILEEGGLDDLIEAERPGTLIGNYQLGEEIGRGGFGVVYRADQQQPIRREVALKIIKAGMDTRQVITRFEAERQALAMMNHPNIAKVLDAGSTDSGRPFFVMELVDGSPITSFCDEEQLGTTQRLELFIDVCHAVQHAHQKGIIHRDLKPSNVMVTRHDGKAVVKVIDFGVAKATQADLAGQTIYTREGQFIGTPAYMSPEQTGAGGGDIDTRSDIYSLGVLLYELLTGTTPFDSRQLAAASEEEVRRVIREEEPARPSTRLRSATTGQARPRFTRDGQAGRTESQSGTAGTSAGISASALKGDLDWIVLKALEKDRERRYETANGLAMDLRRHLDDEPVTAAAPSALYRFQKYARRHRKVLVPAVAIAATLVIGSLISLWQAVEAKEAKRQAENSARDSRHRVADQFLAADSADLGVAQLVQLARENPNDHVAVQRLVSALSYQDFPELIRPVRSSERGLRIARTTEFIDGGSKMVSAVAQKGTVQIWDLESDALQESVLVKDLGPSSVEMLDVNSDETMIAVPRPNNGSIVVLDLRTGEELHHLRHPGIFWCRFSPTGRYLLGWGGSGENKRLWDLESTSEHGTNYEVRTGANSRVANMEPSGGAFSPDGRRVILVGGGGSMASIWKISDIEAGASPDQALPLEGHGGTIWWVEFSPDGKSVVTASVDHTAQVWDAETGERRGAVLQHDGSVNQASFSPDGSIVATTSFDRTARLWDAATGQLLVPPMEHDDFVGWCAFNPTGDRLVTSGGAGRVRVWDVGSGKQVGAEFRHGTHVVSVAFSPNGERILTTTLGDEAGLWRTPSNRPAGSILRHLHRHEIRRANGMVNAAKFSRDGQFVITASRHDGVQLWEAGTGLQVGRKLIEDDSGFDAWAALSDDTRYLVTTERWAGIHFWVRAEDWSAGTKLRAGGNFRYAEFSPNGKRFLASGRTTVVWELEEVAGAIESGKPVEPIWEGPTQDSGTAPSGLTGAYQAHFSPDSKRVVIPSGENAVQVWNIETDEGGVRLEHDGIIESVQFSPDGNRLVSGSRDWTAMVWDAWTGERLLPSPLIHSGSVNHVEFSPDGGSVITASSDGTVRLWDAATGHPLAAPLHHDGAVSMATFSPDGKRVASASSDGTARLWDAATGLPISEPFRHQGWVVSVAFSPDGQRIVTTGNDATARIWEVPEVPLPVPKWFLEWAEGVVGKHITNGVATPLDWNRRREISKKNEGRSGSGFYERITEWYYHDLASRAITPFSEIGFPEYVASELAAATPESLEEAVCVAPDHIEALVAVARHLGKSPADQVATRCRAAFYARSALPKVERALAPSKPSTDPAEERQRRVLLRQMADLLDLLGRSAEAKGIRKQVIAIPPRDPRLDDRMIDLEGHYSASFFAAQEPAADSEGYWLGRLAELYEAGDGPEFDIRGKVQLNSGRYPDDMEGKIAGKDFNEMTGLNRPMKVEGLAIGQRAAKLHFLLGCHRGREEPEVEVARYTLYYEDGSSEPIPVIYGKDMADLWIHNRPKEVKEGLAHIAWEQDFKYGKRRGTLALTRQTWVNNDHPDRIITHLDFESAGRKAAPFLVAITVE